jgi:ubiquinone/menaquinone biosynthesis C-methylase UbiE
MDHADHVRLLRDGVVARNRPVAAGESGVWADLGAGEGAFTLALADLLPPGSTIHAIDRDAEALKELSRRYSRLTASKTTKLDTRVADFTRDLELTGLDGVVMANALHFVRDKAPVLALVRGMLKPSGRFLLVEYDADKGNQWVPHPLSFETWRALADRSGFSGTRKLASVPSRFLGRIFSAESIKG